MKGKKTLYAVCCMLLLGALGCGDQGGGGGGGSGSDGPFHPPLWIQGKWSSGNTPILFRYEFTESNITNSDGKECFADCDTDHADGDTYSVSDSNSQQISVFIREAGFMIMHSITETGIDAGSIEMYRVNSANWD